MPDTIKWARYANPEHTIIEGDCEGIGDFRVTEDQSPSMWATLTAGAVADYAPPVPTIDDYRTAIEAHVDAVARERDYSGAVSISTYANSTNPAWAAEAQAFVAWRDAVWVHAFTELAKVQGGERAVPEVAGFLADLPAMEWPE